MRSETFHGDQFDVVYAEDPPAFSYEATVSDHAGSAEISHPFGMIVLEGSLNVFRPDGVMEDRVRGFVSSETIPTGEWRFAAGANGCRYVCIHPKEDREYARSAIILNANDRSADLSGFDWLLIAEGQATDRDGPVFSQTLVDLRKRKTDYRLTATEASLLVALSEKPAS